MAGSAMGGDEDRNLRTKLFKEEEALIEQIHNKPLIIFDKDSYCVLDIHHFLGCVYEDREIKVYSGLHSPVDAQCIADAPNIFVHIKMVKGNKLQSCLDKSLKITFHANIIGVKGWLRHEDSFLVFYENMALGTLRSMLGTHFKDGMPSSLIKISLKEAIKGLVEIHRHGLTHNEISASQILVGDKSDIKLAFAATSHNYGYVQDDPKLPQFTKETPGVENDIRMIGITALELAYCRYKTTSSLDFEDMVKEIVSTKVFPRTRVAADSFNLPKDFQGFVLECLDPVPAIRPSASALLERRMFKRETRGPAALIEWITSNAAS